MTESQKSKARDAAGDVLVKEINRSLDKGESPVKGGAYKHLLADGKTVSKLLDSGDMRAHITHAGHESGLKVGIFKDDAPTDVTERASGHNKGDSASQTQREFIPTPGGAFTTKIDNKMKAAIEKAVPARGAKRKPVDHDGIETIADIFGDKFLDSVILEAAADIAATEGVAAFSAAVTTVTVEEVASKVSAAVIFSRLYETN